MAHLQINQLKKSYGKTEVIHGLDLEIESGEFCVFVGPSGCGKSTLLRLIAGLETVTSGDLVLEGERVNDVPAAQRGLAMVFQSYALYPHMSVRQNLSFGLENLGMPVEEINRRVNQAAQMLQIESYLQRKPTQLSGGQRQRVAIGRAVVREPKVFLFDEPLSNLDAELRVAMRAEISALHQRLGNTMIYVTHDQIEAMTMADKIAVLRDGRLEQFGRPLDLYNRPDNVFVAGFIGTPRMNFIPARLEDGQLCWSGQHMPCPQGFVSDADRDVLIGIRAGHVHAAPDGAVQLSIENIEQLGGETFHHGTLDTGSAFTWHCIGQSQAAAGESVSLAMDTAEMHLFDAESGASLRVAEPVREPVHQA